MSAHTPGPWEAHAFHQNDTVTGAEYVQVAHVFGPTGGLPLKAEAERHANAALIAAAPDLLEALEAISRAGTLNDQSVIDQMRDAIAKAKGGTP